MSKILGIDLGTTNSAMSVMVGGEPTIIPTSEGERTCPSVVAVNKNHERLVGRAARNQAITNPENTIFSIKRFMGHKYDDEEVQRTIKRVPYKVTKAPNGDVRVVLDGKEYSAPEISAMILAKLKADAEAYLGETITQAVITVPAYFNDAQRNATKDAGKIAGLEVLRIINEPTASSLAYGLDKKSNELIAVYDLGGGTFDVSILDVGDGVFQVRSTSGDTFLGGDDFDNRVMDYLLDEFKKANNMDLRNDRQALQRLKEAAEKAKIELSSTMQTEINLPYITADATGPKHLVLTLTRAKLEQLTGDLITKSLTPVRNALRDAGITTADISEVVMVGGMTRMPAVQEAVKREFGKEPNKGVNPDEVVSIGAAIQGGVLGAAAVLLIYLGYGYDVTRNSINPEILRINEACATTIYALLGFAGLVFGANFCRNVFYANGWLTGFVHDGTIGLMDYAVGYNVMRLRRRRRRKRRRTKNDHSQLYRVSLSDCPRSLYGMHQEESNQDRPWTWNHGLRHQPAYRQHRLQPGRNRSGLLPG